MTIPKIDVLVNVKSFVFRLAYRAGIFHVMKGMNHLRKKRLTVVTYHRVTDGSVEQIGDSLRNLFVNVETFERQILFFKQHYRMVALEDLCGFIEGGKYPSDILLVTFDDGYADFHQHAYPVLKRHGVPATLFVVPAKMGLSGGFPFWWDEMFHYMTYMTRRETAGSPCQMPDDVRTLFLEFNVNAKRVFDKVLDRCSDAEIERILARVRSCGGSDSDLGSARNSMLTWQDIRSMSDLVEIGSHTMNHRNMRFLPGNELRAEVCQSKVEIERMTGKRVVAFSYPNGFHNPEIAECVREAGYRIAFTTDRGIEDMSDPYRVKRINLWERTSSVHNKPFSEGKFALKMTGI